MDINEFKVVTEDLKKRKIPTEVKEVVTSMLDKKGERIQVLKLKGINDITDFMIICTGNSQRQNVAISHAVQKNMQQTFKLKAFSVEGERESSWILLDYIDFIVHIFENDKREKYAIEKLWMDAKRYNFYIDKKPEG